MNRDKGNEFIEKLIAKTEKGLIRWEYDGDDLIWYKGMWKCPDAKIKIRCNGVIVLYDDLGNLSRVNYDVNLHDKLWKAAMMFNDDKVISAVESMLPKEKE